MKIVGILTPLLLLASSVAFAHPDHTHGSVPLSHFVEDPFHLGLAAVAALLAYGLARGRRTTAKERARRRGR